MGTNLEEYGLGKVNLAYTEKEGVEIEVKYSGYLAKQQNQIDQITRQTHRPLPNDLDYDQINTLSKEAREKLNRVKPITVGQAARIGGVNPADINSLLIYLELG